VPVKERCLQCATPIFWKMCRHRLRAGFVHNGRGRQGATRAWSSLTEVRGGHDIVYEEYVFHVHLKDVGASGRHETCRYGQGIVPIRACVEALHTLGYRGAISVEHEPEDFDPTDDCKANLAMLREWLRH
jgi:L-ribulose-5-phosphate 3-epimerase UlaE